MLSGNRNFEARIHPNLKANFLASPPLVVAYAIAGNMTVDLMTQPLGTGKKGQPVYLGDVWPSSDEVHALLKFAMDPKAFRANYDNVAAKPGKLWDAIKGAKGQVYDWPHSSYIAQPPFFQGFTMTPKPLVAGVKDARIMALFGDSITTDHISPAGSIKASSPAGQYLIEQGVKPVDFNSYGSRRGHHEVMMRGTFANVRIKNLMIPAAADGSREEGGVTLYQLTAGSGASTAGDKLPIYDAAINYMEAGVPTVIFAGEEYGTGSSRDWAAKGTMLLGIKAVVAKSFERIHRSNLVGMGVLPLQFKGSDTWQSLGLTGSETIDVELAAQIVPQGDATLVITGADGTPRRVTGDAAHRYADRGRLLCARRHPALRAEAIAGRISPRRQDMIKVSVMYPNKEGARFDHAYYRDKHMPLVKAKMGDACRFYTVDKGLAGGAPGAPADLCGHVPHLLRLGRNLPGRHGAAHEGDHGRHPQLHRHRAGDADQRSGGRAVAEPSSSGHGLGLGLGARIVGIALGARRVEGARVRRVQRQAGLHALDQVRVRQPGAAEGHQVAVSFLQQLFGAAAVQAAGRDEAAAEGCAQPGLEGGRHFGRAHRRMVDLVQVGQLQCAELARQRQVLRLDTIEGPGAVEDTVRRQADADARGADRGHRGPRQPGATMSRQACTKARRWTFTCDG